LHRVAQQPNPRKPRNRKFEQLDAFCGEFVRQVGHAGGVASWLCQARRQPDLNGIDADRIDDRYGLGRLCHPRRYISAQRVDDVGFRSNKINSEIGEALRFAVGVTEFEADVATVHVAQFAQAAQKRLGVGITVGRAVDQHANARPRCCLLCRK